ncbi:MAG: FkbM family methyltransferase [Fibromonadales bacterium]|nr:FkbM family methyltransferase [Fibromonadales bacterium]
MSVNFFQRLGLDEISMININDDIGSVGLIFAHNHYQTIFVTDSQLHFHGIITMGDYFRKATTSKNISQLLNKNYKSIEVETYEEAYYSYMDIEDIANEIFVNALNIRRIPILNNGKLLYVIDRIKVPILPISILFSGWQKKTVHELVEMTKNSLSSIMQKKVVNTVLSAYNALQDDESRLLFTYIYMLRYVNMEQLTDGFYLKEKIILETLKFRFIEKRKNLSSYDVYNVDFFFGEQYYCLQDDEWRFTSNEVYIDCGAYDGFTIKKFCKQAGEYHKIYGFEPIPDLHKMALQNLEKWGIENVEIIQKGLWSSKASFNFSVRNDSGCPRIDCKGNISIEVVSIDEVIPESEKVTFITMDIEGAELEALKGAEKTIRRCKPKLAISIYHKSQDIIEIPSLIISMVPDYRFYIRHHGSLISETILYALPPKEFSIL